MKILLAQILATLVALLLTGCGNTVVEQTDDEDEEKVTETGPFLSMSEFNKRYGHLISIPKSSVEEAINHSTMFFLTPPTDDGEQSRGGLAESAETCHIIHDKITKVNENTIELNFSADTDRCNYAQEGRIKKSVQQRAYAKWTCSDSPITGHEGSRASSKFTRDFCPNDARQETILQFQTIVTYTDGRDTLIQKGMSATMASDGSPCVQTLLGDSIHVANCGSYEVMAEGDPRNVVAKKLVKVEAKNLQGSVGATFYESGTFDITLNQWKGQVEFGAFGVANGDQPPEYRLTKGTSSVEGTYTYVPETVEEPGGEEPQEEENEQEEEETEDPEGEEPEEGVPGLFP